MKETKYFYAVLFLDDFYPERAVDNTTANYQKMVETPQLKKFEITKSTNTENVKWTPDENTLYVRHNLPLPLTLEMWNNEGKPIFYCPLLKEGIDSITVGQVVIESSRAITLHFNEDNPPPTENETFVLALKTLPSFDTKSLRTVEESSDIKNVSRSLDEMINIGQIGKAIIFRRHSLDSLFDLLVDFDESYWHSLAEGSNLKYLTRKSQYQTCSCTCKYTSNLQDVLDLIDTSKYEIEFSWDQLSGKRY